MYLFRTTQNLIFYIFAITFGCHAITFKTIHSLIMGLWLAILFRNSYAQVSKSEYEAISA